MFLSIIFFHTIHTNPILLEQVTQHHIWLQGINITNLKEELLKEENDEDNGNTLESNNLNYQDDVLFDDDDDTSIYSKKKQFRVEDMPEIDITNLY